jgi:hypothetical protein
MTRIFNSFEKIPPCRAPNPNWVVSSLNTLFVFFFLDLCFVLKSDFKFCNMIERCDVCPKYFPEIFKIGLLELGATQARVCTRYALCSKHLSLLKTQALEESRKLCGSRSKFPFPFTVYNQLSHFILTV